MSVVPPIQGPILDYIQIEEDHLYNNHHINKDLPIISNDY